MVIKLKITISHLWFEEIISGDIAGDINVVYENIDSALWYANTMLEGRENLKGVFFLVFIVHNYNKRRVLDLIIIETAKQELQMALNKIKTLRGLIPICSYCKKIRDEKGLWNKLEAYIQNHSEAEFTHGICPECYQIQINEL